MDCDYRIETDGRHTVHYLKIGKNTLYVTRAVGQTESELRSLCQRIVEKLEQETPYTPERTYI